MRATPLLLLLGSASAATTGGTIYATPHDSYSSSIGVLGCKINTDRVAYWPDTVTCDNICVQVSYGGRSVYLLRIDQSGGAHDMSYDAWNYLYTGNSASSKPVAGGEIAMEYKPADPSKCSDLIHTDGGKLPLSAANSMNYLSDCLDNHKDSWVTKGNNYVLYNILDPICTLGYDEQCTLDWPAKNQATCPHTMGIPEVLKSAPVYNIQYPSGKKVLAGSVTTSTSSSSSDSEGVSLVPGIAALAVAAAAHLLL